MPVSWRASGRYTANNTSRGALLLETQAFLLAYGDAAGDLRARAAAARLTLLNTVLQERARESRATTVGRIRERLIQWEPPDWMLDDLVAFARLPELDHLKAALLLHLCRRDALLYDLVQNVVAPRWSTGETTVNNDHVQQFLDAATPAHAEILGWRYETRNKLVSNSLAILRDFGLLTALPRQAVRRITPPIVPPAVMLHLVRLLQAETDEQTVSPLHPDWRLWLWTPVQAQQALDSL